MLWDELIHRQKDHITTLGHWPAGVLLRNSSPGFNRTPLGFLDIPLQPGLQDIILAKLGAEFLEPPPFNLEKVGLQFDLMSNMTPFGTGNSCNRGLHL